MPNLYNGSDLSFLAPTALAASNSSSGLLLPGSVMWNIKSEQSVFSGAILGQLGTTPQMQLAQQLALQQQSNILRLVEHFS